MVHQQDPVGLVTFDQHIRGVIPPKSKRTQLGNILAHLANLKPTGETDIAKSVIQISSLMRHKSLVMIFSDLLAEPGPVFQSLRRLRHRGHDVILFHILDEAEVNFPYEGMIEFEDPESKEKIVVDASSYREDYASEIEGFRALYKQECFQTGIDYVPLDTSMQFDKALLEYLVSRQNRG
jgi:uncharacterized protein (DUF58 family)